MRGAVERALDLSLVTLREVFREREGIATTRPLVLDAAIAGSSIAGTITTASGDRRDFHGWIELTTAIEALLRSDDPGPPEPEDRDPGGVRPAG